MNTRWCYTCLGEGAAVMFNCRRPEYLIGKHIWTEYRESVGQPFQLACQRTMHEQVPITLEDYYASWDRWFENRIWRI